MRVTYVAVGCALAAVEVQFRVLSLDAVGLVGGAPLAPDAGGGARPDALVALVAVELDLFVLPDATHVRPVLVLADDADQQDVAVHDGARVGAVHCGTTYGVRRWWFSTSGS